MLSFILCGLGQDLSLLPLEPAINRGLCQTISNLIRQMVLDLLTAVPRIQVVLQ